MVSKSNYQWKDNYRDDNPLKQRKQFYSYTKPRLNLEREVIKIIKDSKPSRILDVGCGNGDLLVKLQKTLRRPMVGIDNSVGMIQQAKSAAKGLKNVRFTVGDAQNLKFRTNSFDLIVCKHVLYHVKDIQKAIDEAYRCLSPKGIYIATMNSFANLPKTDVHARKAAKMLESKSDLTLRPSHRLAIENFTPFLVAAGFSDIELQVRRSQIELTHSQPYVEYFDSFRDNFLPRPNDVGWRKVLAFIDRTVKREVQAHGKFINPIQRGMFIAAKK